MLVALGGTIGICIFGMGSHPACHNESLDVGMPCASDVAPAYWGFLAVVGGVLLLGQALVLIRGRTGRPRGFSAQLVLSVLAILFFAWIAIASFSHPTDYQGKPPPYWQLHEESMRLLVAWSATAVVVTAAFAGTCAFHFRRRRAPAPAAAAAQL